MRVPVGIMRHCHPLRPPPAHLVTPQHGHPLEPNSCKAYRCLSVPVRCSPVTPCHMCAHVRAHVHDVTLPMYVPTPVQKTTL